MMQAINNTASASRENHKILCPSRAPTDRDCPPIPIICRTVLYFASLITGNDLFSFCAMNSRNPDTIISRVMIRFAQRKAIRDIPSPFFCASNEKSTPPRAKTARNNASMSILSSIGSKAVPNIETACHRLARYPSRWSPIQAMKNRSQP